ncbi:phage minor capsid protein [Streptomyces sp. NPDC015532]|uniref:phage minor capsid protein n=1 Tax=Streptomyces sp. NPDC015532 TaxID=3364960 RepID=UPI0036FDF856
MPIHPGMAEDLSAGVHDLYADAELRLLEIMARQLADGFDAPGWAAAKLAAVQPLRRAAQAVVDVLASAMQLEVFDAVAEAYDVGARAGLAELGALSDADARRAAEVTPNTRAIDRLAAETVQLVTATHRGILRAVEDIYRKVVAAVSGTPLLGIDTRRQATQRAVQRFTDRGIGSFTDKAGRTWSMTTYAEMAVRTSAGRAAVEAHADRLRAADLELVVVSDAPHECLLCAPWEGKVLALNGPGGVRTIGAEHAIDDGRTVRVRIAGSLDEARRQGLQHPNCRHSVSAFLPGVTVLPVEQAQDLDGYEASQRQRAIERAIRKWKVRAAAAVDPAAKRQAEARVRGWQQKMREHLAAHPELRRKREREAIGAGNLPTGRPTPPAEAIDAARLRAGDERTPGEMSDEQFAAAFRSGVLDQGDRDRAAAELDRRDEQVLLDRIRPGGVLADDLTVFSDRELARVLDHLDDEQVLRVMAEMDRRDVAATLPEVRPDLVGLSDEQLAHRARIATDAAEFAALAAEADRRHLLAAVFPGGHFAADLSGFGDEVLAWAVRYARPDEAARIAAEFDRRYPIAPPAMAAGATVDDYLANRSALDEAMRPVSLDHPQPADPDEWGAYGSDITVGPAGTEHMSAAERWAYERELADREAQIAYTREEIREMYREHVHLQVLAAEDYTRGNMLNRKAKAAGVAPYSLFSGPAHVAYARASEDLIRFWEEVSPRVTLAEFTEQVTGIRSDAAETARHAREDQRRKF